MLVARLAVLGQRKLVGSCALGLLQALPTVYQVKRVLKVKKWGGKVLGKIGDAPAVGKAVFLCPGSVPNKKQYTNLIGFERCHCWLGWHVRPFPTTHGPRFRCVFGSHGTAWLGVILP